MRHKFYLNKRDGRLLGVCAGLSDLTGIDVLWIRIAVALLVLAGLGTLLIIYVIVGLVAENRPSPWERLPVRRREDYRRDRGLVGDIEVYYATSNPHLSRTTDRFR